jgi:hypothetical protein
MIGESAYLQRIARARAPRVPRPGPVPAPRGSRLKTLSEYLILFCSMDFRKPDFDSNDSRCTSGVE